MKPITKISEDTIHISIIAYLGYALPRSAIFWHTPNTFPSAKPQYHAKLKRMGRLAGVPDILVLHAGRIFGLEVKATTGRLSESQKAFRPTFENAGGSYHIVRSIDDVKAVLDSHQITRRDAA